MKKYTSLESILGKDTEALTALKRGEFTVEKLGTIPFCEIKQDEYKQIKKDCMKKVLNEKTHQYEDELDDDKLMTKLVVSAVDKETKQPDKRSDFTFANADLLKKLGVVTADGAVNKLMAIGEIYHAATDIQEVCGFTEKAQEEEAEEIKNS
jgi:hypothetical protein